MADNSSVSRCLITIQCSFARRGCGNVLASEKCLFESSIIERDVEATRFLFLPFFLLWERCQILMSMWEVSLAFLLEVEMCEKYQARWMTSVEMETVGKGHIKWNTIEKDGCKVEVTMSPAMTTPQECWME
jgi:hypothetical protein